MEKVLTGIVTIALTLSMGAASGFTGAYTNEVKTGFSQTAGSQAVRYRSEERYSRLPLH